MRDVVRQKKERMEREADGEDPYIPDHEVLFTMFDDEWQRRIREERGEIQQ